MLIVGIGFLDFLDGVDFLPGGNNAVRRRREVVFDRAVEPAEAIAGDGGEHVMLDVIIHVPVDELHKGIERESAATETEVGHVVLEADVLRLVAEAVQPTAVKAVEGGEKRQQPEVKVEGKGDDERMPGEHGARPADGGLAFGGACGEKFLLPFALKLRAGNAEDLFDAKKKAHGIDDAAYDGLPDNDFGGQRDFEVVGLVESIAVVARMTGVEHFKIDPAEEGEDADEEGVERLGTENGVVAEFVHGVDEERAKCAMEQEEEQDDADGPVSGGVEHEAAAEEEKTEKAEGLEPAEEIALLVEGLEGPGIDGSAVPGNGARFSFGHGATISMIALYDFQSYAGGQNRT